MEEKGKLTKKKAVHLLFVIVFCASFTELVMQAGSKYLQMEKNRRIQKELQNRKEADEAQSFPEENGSTEDSTGVAESMQPPEILSRYRKLHETNPDMVGWLTIPDTVIDYPVMQTEWDENHYLTVDFYGQPNENGCLILDTDSAVGTGTAVQKYADGEAPSTNLIIHGHNMKSGAMFGSLLKYKKEEYGKEHTAIFFDSLYEEREYELIAVFYSQVYYREDDVFKYYQFFQADTREEFEDWYTNIKALSLYDTGVTAEYGDRFITLSCCSYQVEDGRFVVVGKQVR